MAQPALKGFHIADYVIFAFTILLSLGIGFFYACTGSKQKTTKEFLVADKKLSVIPVTLSILATFISGFGLLGLAAEINAYGMEYSSYLIAAPLGYFIGIFTFVPLFYSLDITSVNEYLSIRYQSRYAGKLATTLTIFLSLVIMGIGLLGPAIALEGVVPFPYWASMALTAVTATLYTTLGGMKAVVLSDALQSLIIVSGLLAVVIQGLISVGGFGNMWELNRQWNRTNLFDFDFDPTKRVTTWGSLFGTTSLYLAFSASQASVMRYKALPSLNKAKLVILANIPLFWFINILVVLSGLVAFAFYAEKGCDPLQGGYISSSNQILPYFVMDILTIPGLPGLFIASLFSAALSTLSTQLNALVTQLWRDFLQDVKVINNLDESKKALLTKSLVFLFGVVATGVGFLVSFMGGTFTQIAKSLAGSFNGPLLGMSILGATWPRSNFKCILISVLISTSFLLWLSSGARTLELHQTPLPAPVNNCLTHEDNLINASTSWNLGITPTIMMLEEHSDIMSTSLPDIIHAKERSGLELFYSISYMYYTPMGILITCFFGFVLSFIPGFSVEDPVSPDYLFHFIRPLYAKRKETYEINENKKVFIFDATNSTGTIKANGQNGSHHSTNIFTGKAGVESVNEVTSM